MHLERLYLRNFRNYEECDITFHSPVTLVIGRNAMGKTSLLESLYFLCTGESHRANTAVELIRHTSEGFAVTGYFRSDKRLIRLEAVKPRQGAFRLKTDGVLQQRRSDWIGQFNVVVFAPESLELVKGAPTSRRRWLDLFLSQLNREYLEELQRYRGVLQHRNALLKRLSIGKGSVGEISVWDGLLVESGVALIGARHTALARLSGIVETTHLSLTGGRERLLLQYSPGVECAITDISDITNLSDHFRNALAQARRDELRRGVTLVGPHRDDFSLVLETSNGGETLLRETARTYASQGQCRTIALALKLAELEFIREDTGAAPLFLLDDVLSELDVKRRAYLLAYLQGVNAQTVITATDKDVMGDELPDVHLLMVENGVIVN